MSKMPKHIKHLALKQAKQQIKGYRRLPKREKRALLQQILAEVQANYDPQSVAKASECDLLNIQPVPEDVYTLTRMQELLAEFYSGMLPLQLKTNTAALRDPELCAIQKLVDWGFVNQLLAPANYQPGKHKIHPVQLFKAELLKSLQYAEIAYRKYCDREINHPERKENRAFIGLRPGRQITHSQLSTFRHHLSWTQGLNLMVYFIHLFLKSRPLPVTALYGVDSTELAAPISPYPLAKIQVGKQTVRIYSDWQADCGTRRKKRDKATYVVGYRLHTLMVIDVNREVGYPLLSILAPANHHDRHFLKLLVQLGQAIGLQLNVVVGDQAYGETLTDAEAGPEPQPEHAVYVLHEPKAKAALPPLVDPKTFAVYRDPLCEHPLAYVGGDAETGHEFHCQAAAGECPLESVCDGVRQIPLDAGFFGPLPYFLKATQQALDLRKVIERPFNLLKHRQGLEPLRTQSQESTTTVTIVANIANLLIELAGCRHVKTTTEKEQLTLFEKAA